MNAEERAELAMLERTAKAMDLLYQNCVDKQRFYPDWPPKQTDSDRTWEGSIRICCLFRIQDPTYDAMRVAAIRLVASRGLRGIVVGHERQDLYNRYGRSCMALVTRASLDWMQDVELPVDIVFMDRAMCGADKWERMVTQACVPFAKAAVKTGKPFVLAFME